MGVLFKVYLNAILDICTRTHIFIYTWIYNILALYLYHPFINSKLLYNIINIVYLAI